MSQAPFSSSRLWGLAWQGKQVALGITGRQWLKAWILHLRPPSLFSLPSRWGLALSAHGRELLKDKFCGLFNEIPVVAAFTLPLYFRFNHKIFLPPAPPSLWICGFLLVSLKILMTPIRALGLPKGRLAFPTAWAWLSPTYESGDTPFPTKSRKLTGLPPSFQTAENLKQEPTHTLARLPQRALFWKILTK